MGWLKTGIGSNTMRRDHWSLRHFVGIFFIFLGIAFLFLSDRLYSSTNASAEDSAISTSTVKKTLPAQLPIEPITTTHLVTRVVDGDTIVVTHDGATTTVRLIGIDTPETVKQHTPVQCYGPGASAETKKMLTGVFVRLETDPTQDEFDKYHRLLAYVFLGDGSLFNEYFVRNGYAREYTFMNRPYHYQAQFKADQKVAQQEKLGLWEACAN